MTSNKLPKQKQKQPQIPGYPLTKLAGKFEGEFWENTLILPKTFAQYQNGNDFHPDR